MANMAAIVVPVMMALVCRNESTGYSLAITIKILPATSMHNNRTARAAAHFFSVNIKIPPLAS